MTKVVRENGGFCEVTKRKTLKEMNSAERKTRRAELATERKAKADQLRRQDQLLHELGG